MRLNELLQLAWLQPLRPASDGLLIARFPAKHLVSKLETHLKNAVYAHGAASTDLAKIVIGHSRDVCFTSGLNAIAAIHRAAKVLNCSP